MKPVAASLPAGVLAAMLCACGGAEDPPARPAGEDQALERAEAMLGERPEPPQPTESARP